MVTGQLRGARVHTTRRPTVQQARHVPKAVKTRVDFYAVLFAVPFAYLLFIFPILSFDYGQPKLEVNLEPNMLDRAFWPTYAIICLLLALRRPRALIAYLRVPHIALCCAFMVLAFASAIWSQDPGTTFIRAVSQALILTGLFSVSSMASERSDILRALYWVFVVIVVVNAGFVMNQNPHTAAGGTEIVGYPGYFNNKNTHGITCAIAFLIALTQCRGSVLRILFAMTIMATAAVLVVMSKSKGALAFAIVSPFLAWFMLLLRRHFRISPGVLIVAVSMAFFIVAKLHGNLIGRISEAIYHNPTLSNRTLIWNFVLDRINVKPLFGWGYRTFWLVRPDIMKSYPTEEWIKLMPHGHNGYLDMMVELGQVGFVILCFVIFMTFHALSVFAARERWRAWSLLSIGVFVLLMNLVESSWFRGADVLWMAFLIVASETARGHLLYRGQR